jgi:hypothetical protein
MIKKIILPLLLIVPIILSFQNKAYAYAYYYGSHYMTSGVKGYYYIDSSAKKYKSIIDKAINNWNNAKNSPVNFKPTTVKEKADIEFYYTDFAPWKVKDFIAADTLYYKSGKEVHPYEQNWSWAKIRLDKGNFDGWFLPLDDFQKQATVTHEIGHAMGLAHYGNQYSIMHQGDKKINTPDADSVKGINYLYYSCAHYYK